MQESEHSLSGAAMTDMILETFRLNGRLLACGDKLVEGLGITSARWQVLGAIHFANSPQPVASLARSMGLTRQGVQRIVNELKKNGLVTFEPNPHHRRANLVVLTDKGMKIYAAADSRQIEWVNALAHDLDSKEIKSALKIMELIRLKIEESLNED